MSQEGQELITSPADLGLQRSRQVTRARSGKDIGQVPILAESVATASVVTRSERAKTASRHVIAVARQKLV